MDWNALKDEAARMLLEKDALHIYSAFVIQVVAAKASRRSLGHTLPWLAVLGAELLNEANDLRRGGEPDLMAWQVVSGVHDILNTMVLPTVLLLCVRYSRELFRWRSLEGSH
jgi:hypothetical protein